MNLLANLSPTYRQALLASGTAGIDEAAKSGRRPVLPYVQMIDTLQILKQNDPNLYSRVKQETIAYLQDAVRKADAGLDIRQFATRRRGAWLRSLASRLNLLFPRD